MPRSGSGFGLQSLRGPETPCPSSAGANGRDRQAPFRFPGPVRVRARFPLNGFLLTDSHIDEDLRIPFKAGQSVLRDFCPVRAWPEADSERSDHAVAGQAQARKDQMPGLFAAQFGSRAQQLIEHILVAHVRTL